MEAFPFEPVILGDLRQPRSFLFLMIFCELPFLSAKVYQEYEICCFFFCRQVIWSFSMSFSFDRVSVLCSCIFFNLFLIEG